MIIETNVDVFPLKKIFTISRGSRSSAEVVTVKISNDGYEGFGECVPYKRYNETLESVTDQIKNLKPIKDKSELYKLLPPGAARNALDCALWYLEAKSKNMSIEKLTSIDFSPVITSFTLSLDTPKKMGEEAKLHSDLPILKIKLGGGGPEGY